MVVVNDEAVLREPVCDAPMPCEPVRALMGGWWVPFHSYLITREAYLGVNGSDDTLVNAQDFDLMLRLAIAGKKFGYLAGHYADYFRYTSVKSLARGPRQRYWHDCQRAVEKGLEMLRCRGELSKERKAAAARKLHEVARSVYSIDRKWFGDVMERVLALDPKFSPPGSVGYRVGAKLLGFERVERLAQRTRGFRRRRESFSAGGGSGS
jgi:hypothetical protein